MNKINVDEIRFLFEEENIGILTIKCEDDKSVDINRIASIYINGDDLKDKRNGSILYNGYQVSFNGEIVNLENLEELFKFLNLSDKSSIELININYQFKTIKDYLDDKEFAKLDMNGIIHKYENIADSFVLVAPYYQFILNELEIRKTEDTNRLVISNLESDLILRLRQLFDRHVENIRKTTNKKFDEIINEIKEEVFSFLKRLNKRNKLIFMCDRVYKKKTNFCEPKAFFWHAYHDIQFLFDCKKDIENIENIQSDENINIDIIKDLKLLKSFLISATPSYSWHCTITGQLHLVLKFKLTEETKKYLLQFSTDYDLKHLEDLAFYVGDKLLFSSCTHEEFHTDFTSSL